ncbi:MAG: phenylalanine 4-monooxygenase [Alphaproteobacteria bacterium]|nr:phenylalanine 4-monooxygenase [Alphaproteobacteria bacterium]
MGSPKHTTDLDTNYTVDQDWDGYTALEHDTWRRLYARQSALLPNRACPEFLAGLTKLDLNDGGIPDFRRLNESLKALTGWEVVAVPDLVPDAAFFKLLANRQFPAGRFMRKPEEMDYLSEPDVFHDVFGHVPMLTHPVFADYMEAYGKGGLRSLEFDALHHLARLYWYTVEFGLMHGPDGLRIYGAGILSSRTESVFCLESASPNRIAFDLPRVMQTDYRIDDFQQTYFVIDCFEQLLSESYKDFQSIYEALEGAVTYAPDHVCESDSVLNHGTQSHATSAVPK